MNRYDTKDIIYALATARGTGAVAVIRVSGEGCIKALSPFVFRSSKGRAGKGSLKTDVLENGGMEKCPEKGPARNKGVLDPVPSGTAVYVQIRDAEGSEVDDCVVTVYRDRHGYTGEEALEISCHGGTETVHRVLKLLADAGLRQAEPGEFTLRAFLHGKMDLTRAEAVNELINSRGRRGQEAALNRLNGALYRRISEAKALLLDAMGAIEVQLDYAEDELADNVPFPSDKLHCAVSILKNLCSAYSAGKLYSEGARVVLAGRTNAGKSSLFNCFLREDRAIVSSTEGTTRDFIEAQCSVDGIPLRLFDTAGLRETSASPDSVELEGIRRSRLVADSADLVLYLVDSSKPGPEYAAELEKAVQLSESDSRYIPVLTKADIQNPPSSDQFSGISPILKVSAVTGEGFGELCANISKRLLSAAETAGTTDLVIESQRQKSTLERALNSVNQAEIDQSLGLGLDVVAADLQEALEALGELTGEVTTDDILDKIFSQFCVGK